MGTFNFVKQLSSLHAGFILLKKLLSLTVVEIGIFYFFAKCKIILMVFAECVHIKLFVHNIYELHTLIGYQIS